MKAFKIHSTSRWSGIRDRIYIHTRTILSKSTVFDDAKHFLTLTSRNLSQQARPLQTI